MIFHIIAEATSTRLYEAHLDIPYVIPLVYFVTTICTLLIREFSKGWLRYTLAFLFIGSFAALWGVLLLDDNLWRIVVPLIIILAGMVGIWGWLRKVLNEIKRMAEK